jgi:EmrB/QacA subfamily drug resistance transporter
MSPEPTPLDPTGAMTRGVVHPVDSLGVAAARPLAPARQPPVSPWAVLAVASIAVFMVFLDTQVLFVAFGDLRASFPDVSPAALSWVLSAYTIVLAALLVPAGRLADRIGRRRVFLLSLLAFTAASALCAVAPTPELLVAFRALQAVGAAGLLPSSLALVLTSFPRHKIPVAVAIWGAVGALAAAVGPTLGALLVEWWSWHAVFVLNIPVGLVTWVVGRSLLPESKESVGGRLPDAAGVLLLAGSTALLALGVVQSDQWGWVDGRTVLALASGAVLLAGFVARSLRVPNPALDLSLFREGSFRWANVGTAAFTVGFTAMFFANIQFLTQVWQWGIVRAGLALAPGPLVVMVLAPVMGRLAARVGQRRLLVPGGLVYASAGLWFLATLGTDVAWAARYLPGSLLTGLAVAMVLPQLSSAAVQNLPPDRFAVGSAVNQTVRQLGGTFGVALVVALVGTPSATDALARFQRVWWMLVVCGLLTTLAALQLPRRREMTR